MPRLCEFYPGICLTIEEKARKNLSQGTVYILPKHPHITKPTHTHTHTHTHKHARACLHKHTRPHTHTHTNTHTHPLTHTPIYTHTLAHIHTHTHGHTLYTLTQCSEPNSGLWTHERSNGGKVVGNAVKFWCSILQMWGPQ